LAARAGGPIGDACFDGDGVDAARAQRRARRRQQELRAGR